LKSLLTHDDEFSNRKKQKKRKNIFSFHWQTFFNSISDEREKGGKIHAELRNLRTDDQLVQSYSYTFNHLFLILLFTVRDKNTCSRECDKNTMVIHSLGSNYIYIFIYTHTHAQAQKHINWREFHLDYKRKESLSVLIYKKETLSLNRWFDKRKWVSVKALTECAMFDFIDLSPALLLMMTPALLIFWPIQTIGLTHTDG